MRFFGALCNSPRLVAKARRKPVEEDKLVCLKLVAAVQPFCDSLAIVQDSVHGNCRLFLSDTLLVLLAAFFNPTVRSLRLVEQLSQMNWIQGQLNVDRVCRSTLSDALSRFDPRHLLPVINGLMRQIPQLSKRDGDLAGLCKQIIAGDGSSSDRSRRGWQRWSRSCRCWRKSNARRNWNASGSEVA